MLIAIRIPEILKGRYWAEEGRVFFQQGWDLSWHRALLYSHAGYLNLAGNIAGVVANYFVPLEFACYVSIFLALLIQVLPILLLTLSKQKWITRNWNLAYCSLLLTTMPMSQEVWLTSVCSHYHLTLCAALILALEPFTGWAYVLENVLLFVAPLSGPGSVILVPLFWLRLFFDRSRRRIIQCGVITLGAAIQLLFFFHPAGRVILHGADKQSLLGIDPLLLLNVIYVKHVVGPLLGFQETLDVTQSYFKLYQDGTFNPVPGALIVLGSALVMAFMVWRSRLDAARWLFLSGALLSAVSFCGALGNRSDSLMTAVNERYAFAPQVLFEICLVAIFASTRGPVKIILKCLIVWILVIGVHEYFLTPLAFKSGPTWQHEVALWRENPSYVLKIWPEGWQVTLTPVARHGHHSH